MRVELPLFDAAPPVSFARRLAMPVLCLGMIAATSVTLVLEEPSPFVPTVPASVYLEGFVAPIKEQQGREVPGADLTAWPVATPELSVEAPVPSTALVPRLGRATRAVLTRPVALVGPESTSMAWLARHATVLNDLQTQVYVVDARDLQAIESLRARYGNLHVVAARPEALIPDLVRLNQTRLPLFVSRDGYVFREPRREPVSAFELWHASLARGLWE